MIASASLSHAGPCVLGTVADYLALAATGCTLDAGSGTILFNNFTFVHNASGPTTGGSSTQINLTPIVTANTAGFDITPIVVFSASATGVADIELTFVASVVGGANLITGLNSSITGSAGESNVGGGSPGVASLLEDYCRGGSLPPGSCPSGQGGTLVDYLSITGPASATIVSHSSTFPATNALSILKDAQLSGNNGAIPTSVTDIQDTIVLSTHSPEPSTILAVATGLLSLGLFRRMRSRRL